jgi:hypothetical protein
MNETKSKCKHERGKFMESIYICEIAEQLSTTTL